MNIEELKEKDNKKVVLDICGIDEKTKAKLRGIIRFYRGDNYNYNIYIIDEEGTKPCGEIFVNQDVVKKFEDLLGKERIKNSI